MKKKELVSIVITTKNEDDVIENLLKSAKGQTYQNIEIILVDNHSTDDTLKIVKKFDVKIYTFGPERSAQRNFGARKSKGKYLLFLDADMELSPRVIEKCVKIAHEDKVSGVVIPEVSVAKNFWERVKAYERSFYNEEGDIVTDAARFFLKKVFLRAGGYDETITGPEDWDLPENIKDLGYRINRIKSVIYHKERAASPFALAKKKYYYGLKTHRYLKKHNISPISAKTVFFLRPVFFKNWRKITSHPILFLSMLFMLSVELIAGGVGYLIGKLSKK